MLNGLHTLFRFFFKQLCRGSTVKWSCQDLSSGQPSPGTTTKRGIWGSTRPAPSVSMENPDALKAPLFSVFPHPPGEDADLQDTSAGNLTSIHTAGPLTQCASRLMSMEHSGIYTDYSASHKIQACEGKYFLPILQRRKPRLTVVE